MLQKYHKSTFWEIKLPAQNWGRKGGFLRPTMKGIRYADMNFPPLMSYVLSRVQKRVKVYTHVINHLRRKKKCNCIRGHACMEIQFFYLKHLKLAFENPLFAYELDFL